jgi:Zn-dependent protease
MWDDDYDDEYYDRPGRYEVRKVYLIDPRGHDLHRPPGNKFTFSQTELQHLAVAYFVLVICFAIVLSTGFGGLFFGGFDILIFIYIALPVSLIAVGLGFILHEIAHKFAAQRYGCWSEFRYDPRGLMWALGLSIVIGLVWAAPGATWFSGRVTKKENAIISLAGPGVNMTIAIILIPFIFLIPLGFFSIYLFYSGWIIAFLAVFNLLPIPPLDGSKIWKWNLGIYIFIFAIAIAILAFYWFPSLFI